MHFIKQKGHNIKLIFKKGNAVLAYTDQIRSGQEYKEDIKTEPSSEFSSDPLTGNE